MNSWGRNISSSSPPNVSSVVLATAWSRSAFTSTAFTRVFDSEPSEASSTSTVSLGCTAALVAPKAEKLFRPFWSRLGSSPGSRGLLTVAAEPPPVPLSCLVDPSRWKLIRPVVLGSSSPRGVTMSTLFPSSVSTTSGAATSMSAGFESVTGFFMKAQTAIPQNETRSAAPAGTSARENARVAGSGSTNEAPTIGSVFVRPSANASSVSSGRSGS